MLVGDVADGGGVRAGGDDLGIEEGSSGNDKAGMVAMRAKMAAIRAKMVMIVANAHEGDAYDASAAPPESWREDFDLESVPLPEPVKIAFMEDSSRDGPRLLSSTSAPLLGEASTSALGRGGVSEGELTRAMSDLGPDGKGISARAVQAVLERQAIVEAFNDPSAVADRERRRLHGRLPHVFDAVRTAFAARKRSVMELDPLLDELMHTNARAEISAHELADGVRILARMGTKNSFESSLATRRRLASRAPNSPSSAVTPRERRDAI